MGKKKTPSRTVGDTPTPPITKRSLNPAIIDDNIAKLEKAIKAGDVTANPSGTSEETLLTSIGIDGKKYDIGASAENVSYDNTDSGLTADDTQGAIDEIAPALTAEGTSYDNTDSGLTAVNVQSAIDEVLSSLGSKLSLTDVLQFKVQITAQYIILAAITNIDSSDGYHIYFSATTTKGISVYKRENAVSTLLYSFT